MTQDDYLEIILDGYVNNPHFLDNHFYTECKKAEKNQIGYEEFILRLNTSAEHLLTKFNELFQISKDRYYDQLSKREILIDSRSKQGKPINDLVRPQKPREEDFSISLSHFTDKFQGLLSVVDLRDISNAITTTWDKVNGENSAKRPKIDWTFFELFEKDSHYRFIVKLLAGKGFINEKTSVWIDRQKGYRGIFAAIIKDLETKDFYRKDISLTGEMIKNIANNTFKIDLSIDTIKDRPNKKQYDLSFIPYASDLP